MKENFKQPKKKKNYKNELRKVGFEIEYTNVGLERSANIVKEIFGGTLEKKSNYEYKVTNTSYGSFSIEIDTSILVDKKYEKVLKEAGITIEDIDFKNRLEDFLSRMAAIFIPFEIVTPPVPLDNISMINKLNDKLRKADAKGSKSSIIHAFGLHINIEVPSLEGSVLRDYMRAYFLLYDWIVKKTEIDFTRKLTPYIDDYPEAYVGLILKEDYEPDTNTFIEDYLHYNPTRNRSLDMLPIIAFIKDESIESEIKEKGLVKPRPAFHYRLPNCLIDEPTWSPAFEWNFWNEVEILANYKQKLEEMTARHKQIYYTFSGKNKWIEEVESLIGYSD